MRELRARLASPSGCCGWAAQVDGLKREQEAAKAQLAALAEGEREVAAELQAATASLAELHAQLQVGAGGGGGRCVTWGEEKGGGREGGRQGGGSRRPTAAQRAGPRGPVAGTQPALPTCLPALQAAREVGSMAQLPSLLSQAASAYRGLFGLAARGGVTPPFEALPATLTGLHAWADEVAAGARGGGCWGWCRVRGVVFGAEHARARVDRWGGE